MRDIRPDLKERLAAAEQRRASLNAQLKSLNGEVDMLMRLLELEDDRHGEGVPSEKGQEPDTPLAEFIVESAMGGAKSKDEFRELAVRLGYFNEGDSPGRTIHLTIVNLLKHGRLTEVEGGRYIAGKHSAEEADKPSSADMFAPV